MPVKVERTGMLVEGLRYARTNKDTRARCYVEREGALDAPDKGDVAQRFALWVHAVQTGFNRDGGTRLVERQRVRGACAPCGRRAARRISPNHRWNAT